MLATKNPAASMFLWVAAGALILTGCTPSGPRALLAGDQALRDGKYARAVDKLKRGTELLPDDPRSWNLLGLAYHYSGQSAPAINAYRQALSRDRSNLVSVAHYNLGCLLLQEGQAAAAADELRSFTMMSNSPAAWIKLGEAQIRLRQFDAAEGSFARALKLQPKDPEAYNDLGVIAAHRNRTRDASAYIQAALQYNPKYAPALLNSAALAQQNPATHNLALQRYREYLGLRPPPAQQETVKVLVRQLEAELAPKPAPQTNAVVQPLPPPIKTNPPAFAQATNPAPVIQTAAPPHVAVIATTNPPARLAATNSPTRPTAVAAATNVSPRPAVAAVVPNPPPAPPAPGPTNAPVSVPVTVVAVAPPPPIRMAASAPVDVAVAPRPTNAAIPQLGFPPPARAQELPAESAGAKPGFFTKLNPFRKKPEHVTAIEPARVAPPAEPSPTVTRPAAAAEPKVFPRYGYTNPAVPRAGNHAEAERAFQQGLKAQRAGNTNEAFLDYQLAVAADASYFDAQYNYALLTLQMGDLKRSLALWESALAIEPDSINARYNFALALKQDGYAIDAAAELEKIIEAKPAEARAHLTLANLYAQQLGNVTRAREHYLKVLELDPRNQQAPAIRFWLAANP